MKLQQVAWLDSPIQRIWKLENATAGNAIDTVVFECPLGYRAFIPFLSLYVVKTTATALVLWVHRKGVTGYVNEVLMKRNIEAAQPQCWPGNDVTDTDELAAYPLVLEGGDKIELTIAATGGETIVTDTKGIAFLRKEVPP